MTEQEWLSCENLATMLEYLRDDKVSNRKLFLFAAACCRRIWYLRTEPSYQAAFEATEQFADGRTDGDQVVAAWKNAEKMSKNKKLAWQRDEIRNSWCMLPPTAFCLGRQVAQGVVDAYAEHFDRKDDWAGRCDETTRQVALLHHIVGNPFSPCTAVEQFPSTVVELANALYDGQDCGFALLDALLEAGQVELAEHFREKRHPKGCWVLDLLLGKE